MKVKEKKKRKEERIEETVIRNRVTRESMTGVVRLDEIE